MSGWTKSNARRAQLLGSLCLALSACSTAHNNSGTPTAGSGATLVNNAVGNGAGSGGSTAPVANNAGTTANATAGSDAPPVASAGTTGSMPLAGTDAPIITADGGTETQMPTGPSEWRMMGYDLGSTYFNANERVLTKENAADLAEAYTVDMGGNVYGAPLQVGDKIYASGPSSVRALDAATGHELWSVPTGSSCSMSLDHEVLYLNTYSGVVALNATSGATLWSKATDVQGGDGSSSPLVAGDFVFVGGSSGAIELGGGTFRGYLTAFDRMTGALKWTTYTVPQTANGASIWSSPSADLAMGRVFAGTGNNYGAPATDTSDSIIAFNMESGAIEWKNQREPMDTFGGFGGSGPDYDFGANPVLFETMVDGVMTQLVSAGAKSGSAHAVRRDNGELVWTRSLCMGMADGSKGIFVNSTWSGKNMLFACNEGGPATLYGLDGATGDIAWMRPLAGQVWGRMSAANGVGFVGTGTNLEVFDVDTGDLIKSFPSQGGTVAGTITIANGRVAYGEGLSWSSGVRGSTLHVLEVH